jgi:hypothetical protein
LDCGIKNRFDNFGADGLVQGEAVAGSGALSVGTNYAHVVTGGGKSVGEAAMPCAKMPSSLLIKSFIEIFIGLITILN